MRISNDCLGNIWSAESDNIVKIVLEWVLYFFFFLLFSFVPGIVLFNSPSRLEHWTQPAYASSFLSSRYSHGWSLIEFKMDLATSCAGGSTFCTILYTLSLLQLILFFYFYLTVQFFFFCLIFYLLCWFMRFNIKFDFKCPFSITQLIGDFFIFFLYLIFMMKN